ncbi:MAG: hypothetical protein IJN02_11250 [Bacteroidales bacterium]|nr:hypothetical protein [Bacteroidales bacterium]
MKRTLFFLLLAVMMISCGAPKKSVTSVYSDTEKARSLEGNIVKTQEIEITGIEMVQTLNDDGTEMIARPFKWFAAIGKADDKQIAIEIAQREAYAAISRTLNNIVEDNAERGAVVNNGAVQKALDLYWEQTSMSIQNACEPFGKVLVEYDPSTGMYTVTAKVGIRGDRYNTLINKAGNYKPADLTGNELEQYIQINKSIMDAAKGN